jgi:hypothetical protein
MKRRARSLGAALLAAAAAQTACAEPACVSVAKSSYGSEGTESGVTSMHWEAELANDCNAAYDVDLLIELLDGGHEVVYQSHDLVSVPRHATAPARHDFIIPASDFERVRSLAIRVVEERKQPF